MDGCDTILAKNLEEAPITQRDWLATRLHFIVLDDSFNPDKDHLNEVLQALRDSDALARPYWVVKTAAALDHVLLLMGPSHKEFFEFAASRMEGKSKSFQRHLNLQLAQAEQKNRHMTQIRKQWSKPRATSLSPIAVREFESRMHSPD